MEPTTNLTVRLKQREKKRLDRNMKHSDAHTLAEFVRILLDKAQDFWEEKYPPK